MGSRKATILIGVAVVAAALTATAGASFPGTNGRIVFASNRAPDLLLQVFSVPAAGGARRNLSRRPSFINVDPSPSPDGRRLVFSSTPGVGPKPTRIWVLEGPKKPRALATGLFPSWSPDGTRVSFNSPRGGLFVIGARRGPARRISETGSPVGWSPDGSRLAFSDGYGVSWLRSDGTERRLLAPALVVVNDTPPAWAPDGKALVVSARLDWNSEQIDVFVIDVDTGAWRPLAAGTQPRWSPDGRIIAFVQGRVIAAIHPDGSGLHALTAPGPDEGDSQPEWSPNSRQVAFVRQRPAFDVAEASAVGVVDVTSGSERLLTPNEGRVVEGSRRLAWSPDGRRIYYSSRATRPSYHLFTVDRNLRGLEQLTRGPGNDRDPVWAPDGQRVAFVRDGELLEVRGPGGTRPLVHTAGLSSPTWSPDGRRLAYAVEQTLWVIGANGRGRRRLGRGSSPAWSPTGRWLAYERDGIHVVQTDGREDRVVASLRGDFPDLFPTDPTWSPDGRVLYFVQEFRCDQPWLCGPGGPIGAVRPFTTPVREVRLPNYTAENPAISPDGRLFISDGLTIRPRSGFGTSFSRATSAHETEPDWQPLRPRT